MSTMRSASFLLLAFFLTLGFACAEGELADTNTHNPENHGPGLDAGIDDVGGTNNGTGDFDAGDSGEDNTSQEDTGPDNSGEQDAGDCVAPDTCSTVDCGAQHCEPCSGQCVECTLNAHCSGDDICNDDFYCVGCISDNDCFGNLCDPISSQCVDCIDDQDCLGAMICDGASNQCIGCTSDADCNPGLVCDVDTCVECIGDGDCPLSLVCDVTGGQVCKECAGDSDCDTGQICDFAGGQVCVECINDGDCAPGLICDVAGGQTCVECLDDSDCGAGTCHPDYPVCIQPCCSFVTGEVGAPLTVYFRGYGIALDGQQRPLVGLADRTDNRVITRRLANGVWNTEHVANVSLYTLSALSIALDSNDNPHVVLGNYGIFTHYWKSGATWQSHVVADVSGGSFKYVDVDVDGTGTSHMIGTRYSNEILYYSRRTSTGLRGNDNLVVLPGVTIEHARMSVSSNGHVAVVARMDNGQVYLIERPPSGSWQTPQQIGAAGTTFTTAAVAVGHDDQALVATTQGDAALLWEWNGSAWTSQVVSQGPERGRNVRIDLDSTGNPHLWYTASFATDEVYFARREGGQWVEYVVGSFPNADYWEFAVEPDGSPHGIARQAAGQGAIIYATTD